MVCTVLDKSNTRFFHVQYDEDFFDVYIIDDVNSITLFVDDIHKLLKSCNNKDTLILEIDDPYLIAKIESDNGNSRLFEFVLPSDFIDSPNPANVDLPAVLECEVGDIEQSVKDIDLIGSDLFVFVTDGELLTLKTSNDIPTKYANTLNVDYENPCNQTVSARFSLDYIKQIVKFNKINKTVKLKIGDNMPLFYSFKDELMGVSINGMIAPILSTEE